MPTETHEGFTSTLLLIAQSSANHQPHNFFLRYSNIKYLPWFGSSNFRYLLYAIYCNRNHRLLSSSIFAPPPNTCFLTTNNLNLILCTLLNNSHVEYVLFIHYSLQQIIRNQRLPQILPTTIIILPLPLLHRSSLTTRQSSQEPKHNRGNTTTCPS